MKKKYNFIFSQFLFRGAEIELNWQKMCKLFHTFQSQLGLDNILMDCRVSHENFEEEQEKINLLNNENYLAYVNCYEM